MFEALPARSAERRMTQVRGSMSHVETLMPGTELVGDFKIEQVLDAGGFGVTYLAREMALDRLVAIKEYFPADFAARRDRRTAVPRSADCAPDYDWGLERFIDEGQVLARFDHPNIVRVYRYFRANNTAYIVLKYEEGHSFKRWLQELGRAPRQRELDRLVEPLLDALGVVHAADLLHRDIAPDNVIVRSDGSPVLIDFGAARGDLAQFTRTVSALVKPGYSPYEQYAEIGKQQGPWTDIYALAATLYHAVTGKRPPDAPSRVVRDEFVTARDAAVGAYRPRFLKAIDRGLRLEIEKRPQSVAAWRGDLLAPEEKVQRRWFATSLGRGQDADGATDDEAEFAKTVILAEGNGAAVGVMPPPDVPGRRGRIVDFLDGVRSSPRETAKVEADAVTERGRVSSDRAADSQDEDVSRAKRGGLFTRLAFVKVTRAVGDAGTRDRSAESGEGDEDGKEAARREDPAVEPVQAIAPVQVRSRWQRPFLKSLKPVRVSWLAIGTRLALAVGVATLIVNFQGTLSQWRAAEARRLAESRLPPLPDRAPVVTGSFDQAGGSSGDRFSGTANGRDVSNVTSVLPDKSQPTLLMRTFEAHTGGVSHVAFAKGEALLVTSGSDGRLRVWDGETFEAKRSIDLPEGPAFSLAVRGVQALVGQENGRIGLWNLNLGMRLKAFKRNEAAVTTLAFAGQTRFLAGASDWTVSLWDMAQPAVALHTFAGHQRDVLTVAFQDQAGLIASGSADRTVRLWEAKSLSLVTRYPKQRDFVTAVAFSPDGELMLIGTLDGEISLYATAGRQRLLRYRGHEGRVTSLRFVGGGRQFISASADGTIRLWDREQRSERQTFGAAGAAVRAVALGAGGRVIVAGKADGTVQVWRAAGID